MVIIFPPSVTWIAASLRMKNAALELILHRLAQLLYHIYKKDYGSTHANIVSYSSSLICVMGFEDFTDGVDHDVDLPEIPQDVLEELADRRRGGQVP